jgi:hypothetical protein
MKVFFSWSGTRSRAAAELLRDWTKCVIQASEPWISTRDIDRGALWFSEINSGLASTSVGIVCLTQANKNKPWILFEAGALAKGLSTGRVCTFLVDLEPSDIQDPLAQFNHTKPNEDGLWNLVVTLNSTLEKRLDDRILREVFDTYFPQFQHKFASLLQQNPPEENVQPPSEDEMLAQILDSVRGLSGRIRNIERVQDSLTNAEVARAWNATPRSVNIVTQSSPEALRKRDMELVNAAYRTNLPLESVLQTITSKIVKKWANELYAQGPYDPQNDVDPQ